MKESTNLKEAQPQSPSNRNKQAARAFSYGIIFPILASFAALYLRKNHGDDRILNPIWTLLSEKTGKTTAAVSYIAMILYWGIWFARSFASDEANDIHSEKYKNLIKKSSIVEQILFLNMGLLMGDFVAEIVLKDIYQYTHFAYIATFLIMVIGLRVLPWVNDQKREGSNCIIFALYAVATIPHAMWVWLAFC